MMNDNMENTRKYAVVKFKLDSLFSEISIIWLLENDDSDKQWCLWPPRTANCGLLIANYAKPDPKTWIRYEIKFIKLCCEY